MSTARRLPASSIRWQLACGVSLIVLCFWMISWNRVATWLEADALQRESEWTSATGPWHWSLDRSEDIVWPGSHGLERPGPREGGAAGALPNGIAEFSLTRRTGRIDSALIESIGLWAAFDAPARVILLGDSGQGTSIVSERQVEAGDEFFALPAPSDRDPVLDGLRLRIETTPGSRIALRRFALAPPRGIDVAECEAKTSARETLAACDARVVELRMPWSLMPESALRWGDQILELRPGAAIHAPSSIPTFDPIAAATRARPSLGIVIAMVLILLPLLGAALSRFPPAPSRRRVVIELALVFIPWVTMLWYGWPGDDAEVSVSLVLLSCIVSALLMRNIAPDWQWRGDPRAWRASGGLMLASLPLLAATAAANAFDQDGLVLRWLAPEKFWQYPLWAMLQQLLLIHAIAPRMRLAFGSEASGAIATGALFGLLHLPNLSLMLATFIAGSAWAWLGYRHRALMPLVLSHVVLGLAWVWLAPTWLLRSAEIGGRFLMPP